MSNSTIISKDKDMYVVGIGASAGGLEALQELFNNLSSTTGMAFVVVQHLSPNFKSLMDELLSKHTDMPILGARDNAIIQPNHIYLNPSHKNIIVQDGLIRFLPKEPMGSLNLPIDRFFNSLAEEYREKAIGVILSGTGSDGSSGIKVIKENGGIVIVQDPGDAKFDGMPKAAIATKTPDLVLPVAAIGQKLSRLNLEPGGYVNDEAHELTYKEIFAAIKQATRLDFSNYKMGTIKRRIEKRMNINHLKNLADYRDYLHRNKNEAELLANEFLIRVTNFFRDGSEFELLKNSVIPSIFTKAKKDETIRVWAAGCSTGDEAYSIAMLMEEHLLACKLAIDYKIFASDIDVEALEIAGTGIYSEVALLDVPRAYKERYFRKKGDDYTIKQRIREKIVFARHDLLKDPPFINVDLITCRNLLIYLKYEVQKQVLNNFYFALNVKSFLFLGKSESISGFETAFEPVSEHVKIFTNVPDITRKKSREYELSRLTGPSLDVSRASSVSFGKSKQMEYNRFFTSSLLRNFVPSCIFLNKEYDILFINGDVSSYFNFPQGMPNFNLLELLDDTQALTFKDGVRQATQTGKSVSYVQTKFYKGDKNIFVDLKFMPYFWPEQNEYVILVEFKNQTQVESTEQEGTEFSPDDFQTRRIITLEEELKETRAKLQAAVEKMETANEELQASNEELLTSNEELQSTNEELQSVNEEIYTVNTELSHKVRELADLNDDVNNMIDSTQIGVVFLDHSLKIRKFTPEITKLFNLDEADIGRDISKFTANFASDTLVANCKKVLGDGKATEREVRNKSGQYYLKRITPYYTKDGQIDGVVISFLDVDKLKRAQRAQEIAFARYKQLFDNIQDIVFITDEKGVVEDVNHVAQGFTREEVIGTSVYEYNDQKTVRIIRKGLKELFKSAQAFTYQTRIYNQSLKRYNHFKISAIPFVVNNSVERAAFISNNLTDLIEKNERIAEQNHLMETILNSIRDSVVVTDKEGKVLLFNQASSKLLKNGMKDIALAEWSTHYHSFYADHSELIPVSDFPLARALRGETVTDFVFHLQHKEGSNDGLYMEAFATPLRNDNGDVNGAVGVFSNITKEFEAKKTMEGLLEKQKEITELKSKFVSLTSHQMRTPLAAIQANVDLLSMHSDKLTKEKSVKIFERLNTETARLKSLMDDVLILSKAEKGKIGGDVEDVRIDELLREIIGSHFGFDGSLPEIKLTVTGEPISIKLVKYQVEHSLINLISNAIKYSSGKKAPEVNVVFKADAIKVTIADKGIGVPKDDLPYIFDPFFRSSNVDGIPGTGLGLSITREFLSYNNAIIAAESKEGAGTTFTIDFKVLSGSSIK
ncbi:MULTISPECIES: CheR family methyltransferase [unclassified Imperialibacter]|uniref:CheR family methyltransferase n=1 Tax=unclassified Imperialibacter TaxID=2629706 RepID=UPI00125632EC|nr:MULTISPECIES: CheR family methyltransferase [unclassified Imperialibacter]CAD5249133.1 putative Two-component system, chemotaxis family, CheB/CheR fusion protein [Imperialibacter sp. 89]CAD5264074.1 putative Two-component system, chemotaxis family, CheB/CheR fusion protein [Imperialibacter sp. 75]VVT07182.1 putative Protein-glutamate methylesterase [Imperialibacter sp. EC-SDR9]